MPNPYHLIADERLYQDWLSSVAVVPPLTDDGSGQVFNVKHPKYGARGDGVSDDTAAIKAAMVAAAAVGGEVFLPGGTYIANMADTPARSTSYIRIRGAGKYATIIKGSLAVDHVLGLLMPGEVCDLTVDGGAIATNGLVMETSGTIAISEMAARRVRCRNVSATGFWNMVVWDTAQIFQIDHVYLDDVTVEGPSPAATDAFAVSYVNVCHVRDLEFRGLQRTPNFYVIHDLLIDGLVSDGGLGVGAFVIDAGVDRAVVNNVVLDTPNASSAVILINAPYLVATNWVTKNTQWGIGVDSGAGFVAGATWMFENCQFASGITFRQPMRLLSCVNCDLGAQSGGRVIADLSPATSVTTHVRLVGCTCDGTSFNYPFSLASNAVTWTKFTMQACELLRMPAALFDANITVTTPNLRNNPGYNPVGVVTPAVPASTVAVAAALYDRTFYITTGAGATTIAIQGGPTITLAASTAGQSVRVPAGKTMTPTYANAPTWVVEGE